MVSERGYTRLIVFTHACGYYSRAATIRGAASIRINTVLSEEMGKHIHVPNSKLEGWGGGNIGARLLVIIWFGLMSFADNAHTCPVAVTSGSALCGQR